MEICEQDFRIIAEDEFIMFPEYRSELAKCIATLIKLNKKDCFGTNSSIVKMCIDNLQEVRYDRL